MIHRSAGSLIWDRDRVSFRARSGVFPDPSLITTAPSTPRVRHLNAWTKRALQFACCAALAYSLAAASDDEDEAPKSGEQSAAPSLSGEQQRAVGVQIAHLTAAKAPERTLALGLVLDATTLLSDEGEAAVADAQEHAASAEASRLLELYKAGAGASLKMLETAQADAAKAHVDAQLAAARFAQHWGPLATQAAGTRARLLNAVTAGRSVLVRAEVPGRHIVAALPTKAMLDVDGIEVPGRVLGTLRQFSELQSAGLLIEVEDAPAGLAAGARVPLALLSAGRNGMLVPPDALLYDEHGAYVYKQVSAKAPSEKTRYVPVKVTLLAPYGDGWLVQGVDDDDDIVVQGAGVLWSLQGVGAGAADEDED
jgi:hypothetical protein